LGHKIEIMVFSDRGSHAEMTERQYKYRIEVGQYMERDLINRLRRSGYEAKPIMAWDDGVGTSEHWSRLPRKLNANTVKRITKKLTASK